MDIFGFHKGKNPSTISRLFRGPFCWWTSPTVALQTPTPVTCTIKETQNMPPYFRQSFASRQPSPCSSGGFLSVPRWRHYWLGGNSSKADIRSEPLGGREGESVTPRATPSATQTNCLKKKKKNGHTFATASRLRSVSCSHSGHPLAPWFGFVFYSFSGPRWGYANKSIWNFYKKKGIFMKNKGRAFQFENHRC